MQVVVNNAGDLQIVYEMKSAVVKRAEFLGVGGCTRTIGIDLKKGVSNF
ncbi:dubious [Schizosaccharomyces pombe]|uniref:Uncharacterized protein C2A9.13 n=1 Tax=Schizosaccharomyces pombe (strain 972 / ATCC 24843) TaxID=284812 RepID=YGID_SCHPO|nr:uncharacterized protein SPBC2A9.13 [Schizosaccharomyces pombe]Q9P7Z4.1 RecName: Full=Uncharacterized protein C2A9.13 [Schizosaccharomyces pombe 972h-]CAB66421.1 sequence orphan [Schizosaccharomyces pombe]|eukprot:NP_596217.1 uncharacterized protein SPBC2A9.13 [Schizosaccharomyces pombe]